MAWAKFNRDPSCPACLPRTRSNGYVAVVATRPAMPPVMKLPSTLNVAFKASFVANARPRACAEIKIGKGMATSLQLRWSCRTFKADCLERQFFFFEIF